MDEDTSGGRKGLPPDGKLVLRTKRSTSLNSDQCKNNFKKTRNWCPQTPLEEVNATSGGKTKKSKPIKNVMIYLIALFVPPLYFIIKKKWLAFVTSAFLMFLSPFFLITGFLAPVAFFFWFACAICAIWNLRKHVMRENAKVLAEEMAVKMAEVMRAQQPTSVPPRM
jgi:hypothetical protein